MDAQAALAELLELSSQVETAAILTATGSVEASTLGDEARAERLAQAGRDLLEAAAGVRRDGPAVTRVEVDLPTESVFVLREKTRTIVATTVPEPTAGLVVYDLRTALRRLEEPEPAVSAPARTKSRKSEQADA